MKFELVILRCIIAYISKAFEKLRRTKDEKSSEPEK